MTDVTAYLRLTIFFHVDQEAFAEAARLALVAPGDVNDALPVLLADVLQVASDGALEEPAAPVTTRHSVVLPRGLVPAHLALRLRQTIHVPRPRPAKNISV